MTFMLKLGQITKLQNNIVNIGLDSNFIFYTTTVNVLFITGSCLVTDAVMLDQWQLELLQTCTTNHFFLLPLLKSKVSCINI